MIAERISHYRILSKLGSGGMGEVYLAEDVRLSRQVAIKVLSPATTQTKNDSSSRFLKEARAASALRSPNIASIYDIGEQDGLSYIVLEYVQGEDLSHRLERGPLPLFEALEISIQIADALDEAHSRGIIHRDIKASNVMLTDRGLVKILDFGLAKFIGDNLPSAYGSDPDRFSKETLPGTVLGTPSYMSPEQARGLEVDGRTDIFSLGVLIYRMITGRAPFEGDSFGDVMVSILEREPPPLSQFMPGLPEDTERVISKALSKGADDRYQTARDLIKELNSLIEQLGPRTEGDSQPHRSTFATQTSDGSLLPTQIFKGAVPASSGRKRKSRVSESSLSAPSRKRRTVDSIAVLPLRNLNADSNSEYLSDGIAESLMMSLSQLPKLRVIAPSTVFRFKGKDVDPQTVGRELGVRAVLIGKLSSTDDQLRVSAELVDAVDGSLMWGEVYNRKLADILLIQDEISNEILGKLRVKLTAKEKKRLVKKPTQNTEAYQFLLKGRYHAQRMTRENYEMALAYFKQALEVDPNYAAAYAGMANTYVGLWHFGHVAAEDTIPQARAAAQKAIDLDPDLAEPHVALAALKLLYELDFERAEVEIKSALQRSPNDSAAHELFGVCLAALGRPDEAVEEAKLAWENDVLSPLTNLGLAGSLFHARRYEKAISQCHKILKLEPNFLQAYECLAGACEMAGKSDESFDAHLKVLELRGAPVESIDRLKNSYSKSGMEGFWRTRREMIVASPNIHPPELYQLAQICSCLNDIDSAFEWLEKAVSARSGRLVFLAVDPCIDSLRPDPRFQSISQRLRLVQ